MIKQLSVATLAGVMVSSAFSQSDRSVSTVRERPAPGIPQKLVGQFNVSDQPRYYMDTVDNLNRIATDDTRPAGVPGLSKNNYVAKIYPVYNTNAIEIQSYLLRSLAYEGGTCEVMGAAGVEESEDVDVQYLYVTAPDFMIPGITEIVEMSDKPGFKFFDQTGLNFGGGPGAVRYVGKHRTASELVNILSGTELGNVGAFLFPPFADDSTNSIYIVENPTDIADDIAALEMFDKAPLQVELEVKIYEISDADRGKVGLDWDSWKRFISGNFTYSDLNTDSFFNSSDGTYSTILDLNAAALTEFLNYTVSTGTTNLMTSAKVTMVNSEDIPGGLSGGNRGTATADPAVISTMTTIPFVRTLGTNGVRTEYTAEEFTEGIRLEMRPFIGINSMTMEVDVTVNSLVGFTPEENVPMISSRESSSVVNIADGEYLVLSGLRKENTVNTRTGIPGLKDIPVVQYLFSKEVTKTEASDILISLRPVIKDSDSQSDAELAMK